MLKKFPSKIYSQENQNNCYIPRFLPGIEKQLGSVVITIVYSIHPFF